MFSNIFVVEDEFVIFELILVNFQYVGYCLICVYNVEQVQNLISDVLFDFVLFDWMLLGKFGIVFVCDLCNNEWIKYILIIMFIVCGDEQDKVFGFEIGVDDYVMNLFLLKELMVWIKVVLCCCVLQLIEDVVLINGLCFDLVMYCVVVYGDGSEIKFDFGLIEFCLLYFFMMYLECVYSCM